MGRNPRVFVTLEQEDHDALARIARYTDGSMSGIIGQLVKDAGPVLRQLADALEEAHGLSMKLPGSLTAKLDALGRAAQEVEHGTQELLDQVQEEAAAKREELGEKVRRRAASQGKTL